MGLVFTTFIWGVSFEIVAESLKGIPPLLFSAIRFFIAFLLIFLVVIYRNFFYNELSITRSELKAGLVCGSFLFLGYFFQKYGLWGNGLDLLGFDSSDPNKSAFITGTSVLMVPIILFFLGKVNQNIHLWISIIIVLLGLAILLNPNVEQFTIGDLLTFGCSLSFAIHIILQGKYIIRDLNIYNFFMVQIAWVTVLCFFGCL